MRNGKNKKIMKSIKGRKLTAAAILGFALITGISGVPATGMTENGAYIAEAKAKKKDKKKPVIKFSGKSTITVEQNKSVKIPKTTAKDNKDGNVTKKITVTVKKGKKKYSSIAKKIKNNKSVKFTSTGTYKITYTVKDKAGNKATKTRTIKVLNPKKKVTPQTPTPQVPTTERVTTEKPTTEATTERVTTEKATTEATTEKPTTEQPSFKFYELPEPVIGDGEWKFNQIKLNNQIYYVINDKDFETSFFDSHDGTYEDYLPEKSPKLKFNIENDYEYLMLSKDSGLIGNAEYLKFLGLITAKRRDGSEISPSLEMNIYSPFNKNNVKSGPNNVVYIYINGNRDQVMIPVYLNIVDFDKNKNYDEDSFKSQGYELLSKSPLVYGKKRS